MAQGCVGVAFLLSTSDTVAGKAVWGDMAFVGSLASCSKHELGMTKMLLSPCLCAADC